MVDFQMRGVKRSDGRIASSSFEEIDPMGSGD